MQTPKSGKRLYKVQQDKKVRKGIKDFYTRLARLNDLAVYLTENNIEVNEENIDEVMPRIVGRTLDSMEKMIVLSKLANNSEKEDNTEEHRSVSGGEHSDVTSEAGNETGLVSGTDSVSDSQV